MADSEDIVKEVIVTHSVDVLAVTKALVENPQLGLKIREIDFDGWTEVDEDKIFLQELSDTISPGIGPEILDNIGSEDIAQQKEVGDWMSKVFLELWLFHASNLEKLSITLESCFDFGYFNNLRQKYSHLTFLPKLKHIDARYWSSKYGMDLAVLTPLISATSAGKVSVFRCEGFQLDRELACSQVRELELDSVGLSSSEFDGMVKCFPNLEVLRYRLGDGTCLQGVYGYLITAREMSEALRPLSGTLRELEIDQREHAEVMPIEELEPIDTLKYLSKLEELKIWQYDLVAKGEEDDTTFLDKLPKSLKTISIIGEKIRSEVQEALAAAGLELVKHRDS